LRYLILLKVCVFSFLMACQTNQPTPYGNNITGNYTGPTIGNKVALNEEGQCIANNLRFLVGQPETALGAMEYPANTRIIFLDKNESIENSNPKRLSIVVGSQRKIVSVYCG
jgi:hypothetical protein